MLTVEDLPEIDLYGPGFLADPSGVIDNALKNGPMARSYRGVEVLSHRLCQSVLRDKRLRANHMKVVKLLEIPEGPVLEFKKRMLLGQGLTEDRTAIRQVFVRNLGPAKAQDMRKEIREIVEELLDDLVAAADGGPVDFLNGLCMMLPSRLYCNWMGAPKEDAEFAARISEQVLRIFEQRKSDVPAILSGYQELFAYIDDQIAKTRLNPQDNVLGSLLSEIDRGVLSEVQVNDFACMLLEAATDNTSHQIALVVATILESPADWRRIVADQSLIRGAIQEAIRLNSRTVRTIRYPIDDIDLEGVHIPAEMPVTLLAWAAHRDPSAFPDPDKLDIERKGAARVQTFGGGSFSCLGQHIAEIEIAETLSAIAERFPNSRIAAHETAHTPFSGIIYRLNIELVA